MYIYRGEEIKEADAAAERDGMDTFTLMENAGRSLFLAIQKEVPVHKKILIVAGRGNNGGDGIVLARYLKNAGYPADLTFPLGEAASEVARRHFHYYKQCGYSTVEPGSGYDVVIDGLLGVGTRHPLPEDITSIIQWINEQAAYKIAIDLPTGVLADKGDVKEAVKADWTLSLHGLKPSAFLEGSTEYYGKRESLDIGLAHHSKCRIWTKDDVKASFLKREASSHKGTFGTGLLIAGSDEMPGSSVLSSLGAMKSGIGKLLVATTPYVAAIIAGRVPECTFIHDGLKKIAYGQIPYSIKAIAIGPGLDDTKKVESALVHLFKTENPLVLDAGALDKRSYPERKGMIVVTPHPGEFSRMTGLPVEEIQKNRIQTAQEYAKEHQVTVVLKGRYTVIAFPDGETLLNNTGNAGLAKGGSGDTLTGILLAFLSSYSDHKAAVANAVYLHGACADAWIKGNSMASMVATDISNQLEFVLKEFE
ncbi:NAD(P)H-hydrate dehydratase [Bacillus sp. 1P06AnD]|uniref:NAD(P)H-hydrate dehydratase n=1 Tax=Bacillus sp. 1P06AnD TaxID=3132208 RepID=UPI0039A2A1B2